MVSKSLKISQGKLFVNDHESYMFVVSTKSTNFHKGLESENGYFPLQFLCPIWYGPHNTATGSHTNDVLRT